MNDLIKHTIQTLLFLVAIITVLSLADAYAQTAEDYYAMQGFSPEQLAEMERQANLEWQQEQGDLPPNLTVEAEKYLKNYTVLLQEEINNGK
ncbi:hypothetical protein N8E87_03370 [Avibacterium paragallinarum]|uniref:hypothetical protein n=1 Tax=Avibacterium paragallinarum TaxID=728 RepID=UPI0021F7BD73|nr:hypothetical protein [Avibacterium paragallinarum]UXN37524.1 hypothetical protein N8E87_03370 [Avibacterium paragallinarum]